MWKERLRKISLAGAAALFAVSLMGLYPASDVAANENGPAIMQRIPTPTPVPRQLEPRYRLKRCTVTDENGITRVVYYWNECPGGGQFGDFVLFNP